MGASIDSVTGAFTFMNGRKIKTLPFLGRRDECYELAFFNLMNQQNILSCPWAKQTLISAGQMEGSGKTSLGMRAVAALQACPEARESLQHFNQVKHTMRFCGLGILDAYLGSIVIRIALADHQPEAGSGWFASHIAYALYCSFSSVLDPCCDRPKYSDFLKFELGSALAVASHFQALHPGKTFFLHWDDANAMECINYAAAFGWKAAADDGSGMQGYCALWAQLAPLLGVEGLYHFVSAKRPAFAMIYNGAAQGMEPQTELAQVVLGGLTPHTITEALHTGSLIDGTQISDCVRVDPTVIGFFGERVHEVTAGVPWLTAKTLEALCCLQQEPLLLCDVRGIEDALEACYSRVRPLVPFCSFIGDRHLEVLEIYVALMAISLLKQPMLPHESVFMTGSSSAIHLLQLLDHLKLCIERPERSGVSNQDMLCFRFSEWSLRRIREQFLLPDLRFALLAPVLRAAAALDGCPPFELILRISLVSAMGLAASSTDRWADRFPVFANTLVAENSLRLSRSKPVSLVPAVDQAIAPIQSETDVIERFGSESQVWRRKMSSRDWPRAFCELVGPSSIVQPPPGSASPDLIFSGLDTETSMTAWAIKYNTESDPVTFAVVQEEVHKAASLLEVKDVCLVIAAMHLDTEIRGALASLRSNRLLLWGHIGLTGEGVLVDRPRASESRVRIPDGMNVLVLGSKALGSVVGHANLAALGSLGDVRQRGQLRLYIEALQPPPPPPPLIPAAAPNATAISKVHVGKKQRQGLGSK